MRFLIGRRDRFLGDRPLGRLCGAMRALLGASLLGVAIALGAGLTGLLSRSRPAVSASPSPIPVVEAAVRQHDVPRILTGLGTVQALNTATIRSQVTGVLQTVNSLGMSLAIAGIGAIFFALAGGHGQHVPVYLHAAEWTALATVVLLAASFAVAFRLPRRART